MINITNIIMNILFLNMDKWVQLWCPLLVVLPSCASLIDGLNFNSIKKNVFTVIFGRVTPKIKIDLL